MVLPAPPPARDPQSMGLLEHIKDSGMKGGITKGIQNWVKADPAKETKRGILIGTAIIVAAVVLFALSQGWIAIPGLGFLAAGGISGSLGAAFGTAQMLIPFTVIWTGWKILAPQLASLRSDGYKDTVEKNIEKISKVADPYMSVLKGFTYLGFGIAAKDFGTIVIGAIIFLGYGMHAVYAWDKNAREDARNTYREPPPYQHASHLRRETDREHRSSFSDRRWEDRVDTARMRQYQMDVESREQLFDEHKYSSDLEFD